MKNNIISNFDQIIQKKQPVSNINSISEENNQRIRELNNNMISNQLIVNKIAPDFTIVSLIYKFLITFNIISY